jgi:SAM-dependent methyltransferase
MIDKARVKYPALEFIVGDGEDFKFEEKFDAVFSNAALHWMKRPQQVISCVGKALRKEGRFVAEFGGAGNVEIITNAIIQVISKTHHMKVDHLHPWYFPSIAQYTSLLEQQGFQVKYAHHFDRPTQLEDGEHGLHHWLNSFADSFFVGYTEVEKTVLFNKIADQVKPVLFHDGSWHADYKRLRIVAINTQPSN